MEDLTNSLAFVEGIYADYLRDPASVAPDWKKYFESLDKGEGIQARAALGPSFHPASIFNPAAKTSGNGAGGKQEVEVAVRQDLVNLLVRNYRVRGHMIARLDPLGLSRPQPTELNPEHYGLSEADMERFFSTLSVQGPNVQTLRNILRRMRNTYCRSIGAQFMHIDDLSVREWLQERMEGSENRLALSRKEQIRIFTRLTDAVIFEQFIQKKFIGAKSFSLQGAESLIPLLDLAVEKAGQQGVREVVLGMAHRGRLNVLANIVGKGAKQIFREFEDMDPELYQGKGDVKYHLGHSGDWQTSSGQNIHLTLCFNPSHLEFINPVALGRARAKQDRFGDRNRERCMVLLIHGDASFAGEGIVQETLNLSELKGYAVGGTFHVIINNQLGFTTSPQEARSSGYATDIAKMLQIPIFHVNGEDPEAVAQVVRLAMDFRHTFKRDVVIDMYCYRRYGHNESDEPSFTQPLLYRAIEARKSVREGYLDHLLTMQGITRDEADQIADERRQYLERELSVARSKEYVPRSQTLEGIWSGYVGGLESKVPDVETGVDRQLLSELLLSQTKLPKNFHPHPKIEKILKVRAEMARGEKTLDWASAEALAFASLVTAGHRVRFTGQDSERGTFSHRHAVLHDIEDGHTYTPLQNLAFGQAPIEIVNSPLSEAGVLGYEYGYSLDTPEGLVIWEAQFGDFFNAAQVIVDQFIVSAEDKWRRLSGIVLLLPHGFEGQGPEHSSARIERFLLLAAEDNIQLVNPTTPAQYFHCLRRQVVRPLRKPLIVMTPKSLLRHPLASSSLDDLASGSFQRLLLDQEVKPANAKRVVFCSGKIYYDLVQERKARKRSDLAIHRVEQIYPLAIESIEQALTGCAEGTQVAWVQEEPMNMGVWRFLRARLGETLFGKYPLIGISRPASASPATGSASSHRLEQKWVIERTFGEDW